MLRNRSRAVTSKQALNMSDQNSLLSPTKQVSSFLNSPRFFNSFLAKTLSDSGENSAAVMSPTSILDTKNSSNFVNPFGYDKFSPKSQTPSPEIVVNKSETEAIGLALIDSIINDDESSFSKPVNRMALFGSKLKVQIPVMNPGESNSIAISPKSPADFGIKTRNSQFSSPFCATPKTPNPVVKDFSRQLSLKEMELSEDYTCVITHGPNPKTKHIFDDCVVECCCLDDDHDDSNGNIEVDHKKMECGLGTNVESSADFLSFCHTCKDSLGQGKDIYMYRGEKAFCSNECRCEEIMYEGMKKNPRNG